MTQVAAVPTRPIVFFHVMKCGGTSVRRSLIDTARRASGEVFELQGEAAMAAVGGIIHQDENWRFRRELLAYLLHGTPPAVIVGHFRYHHALAPLRDRAHFVTVLRPPVDRVVSLYRYRRYSGRRGGIPAPAALRDILDDPAWQSAGHHYVETFCGDPGLDPRSERAIDAAIENLSSFRVVGDTGAMADFAAAMSALTGADVAVDHRNASPAPDDLPDPTELRAELEELCAPDRRVYEEVLAS
jgi:hypothetical protein